MLTDSEGLNTSSGKAADKNLVSETLNALAGKLYYEAYKNGEKNLAGTVEIAEGLTAQSATKRLETMTYKAGTGQGQYLYTPATEDNPNPNPTEPEPESQSEPQSQSQPRPQAEASHYLWKQRNPDDERRQNSHDLCRPSVERKQQRPAEKTYDIAQVGYDKKKGNWTIRAALDYGTGKDTYANRTGKGKLASLALYGTMQKEDGQYIDVILKGSHIKNDYTVYNEMNHRPENRQTGHNGPERQLDEQ